MQGAAIRTQVRAADHVAAIGKFLFGKTVLRKIRVQKGDAALLVSDGVFRSRAFAVVLALDVADIMKKSGQDSQFRSLHAELHAGQSRSMHQPGHGQNHGKRVVKIVVQGVAGLISRIFPSKKPQRVQKGAPKGPPDGKRIGRSGPQLIPTGLPFADANAAGGS